MKTTLNIAVWIVILLFSFLLNAQEYEGSWTGSIQNMPLVFEITQTDAGYTAKMQSPTQSKTFLPMDTVVVKEDGITLTLNAYKISYTGKLQDGMIMGSFTQGGGSGELNLENKAYVEKQVNRPQEPKAPFPYLVEEVSFENPKANNIKLAGTLTLPGNEKNPTVAIMISGSGPQDRNEELFDHKPFMVIADHLTKNGIAVLRYDDRGVAQSEGTQDNATSADFATDVEAAIAYLKTRNDINKKEIGLIGHSEGGLIAPIVISNNPADVAFFISLAGTGIRGDKVLLPQMRRNAELQGSDPSDIDFEMMMIKEIIDEIVASTDATEEDLQTKIIAIVQKNAAIAPENLKTTYTQEYATNLAKQFGGAWFRYFMTYDPAENLQKVKIPVLALNGSLDYQVIPELNLPGIKSAFEKAKNTDVTIKILPGLNHLFQNAITGGGGEYQQIEETFDPQTLNLISSWINERF
ncbi:alpha/beta hydrolase family protein [Nonlabens antarcticus]|uniref:alpha/beta hydrolase family protein n=1 Tax=Nonlabens antarcticus TaxID=392714 RepID=UPI0018919EAF|nr:alpha/beta fold hydrolase [Nonlabens antarcticus]